MEEDDEGGKFASEDSRLRILVQSGKSCLYPIGPAPWRILVEV